MKPRLLGAAALYVTLTAVYGWPLFGQLSTALPNDAGDPALNAWILWWNAHAVPFSASWWDAPAFFPSTGAFAYSETLLSLSLISTPLQWAGLDPVAAYNVLFLLSFPAAALAAHALAYRLTGRHAAALLAGLAFGFSPYRVSQFPHLQLLWSCWMPLCLLALDHYRDSKRTKHLVLAGIAWTLNGFTCGYYLEFFAVLVLLWMIWFLPARRDWIRVTAALAISSIPFVPLLLGYARHLGAIGASRSRGEIESLSADLSAIWATSPTNWLASKWTLAPNPEGELYPGIVILGLAVAGAIVAWRRLPAPYRPEPRKGIFFTGLAALSAACLVWISGGFSSSAFGVPVSVTRPHRLVGIGIMLVAIALLFDRRIRGGWRRRSVFFFYLATTAAMFVFALGPVAHAFGARFMDRAPYYWLMQLPGGESLRVPARFAMLFLLCLGQAAAIGMGRLTPALTRGPVVACLAVLVLVDGWVFRLPTVPVSAALDLRDLDPSAAVIELPMRDLYDDTAAMLHATSHGRKLVNGFSGYSPPYYGALQTGFQVSDPSVFEALRRFAPLIVVVNRAKDGDGRWTELVERVSDARLAFESPAGPVYLMSKLAPPASVPVAAVSVSSVTASENADDAGLMIDRDVRSRWRTVKAQTPGPEVSIVLERDADVSRIEMDLGSEGGERTYPRLLRVSVATGNDTPLPVWEAGLAGAAVVAAHRDRLQTTIAVDLPAPVRARRIVLTQLGRDVEEPWSIAELRVFQPAGAGAR